MEDNLNLIKRGIDELLNEAELISKLKTKKQLVVKAGFDPTAPDLHLGHTVLINKLRHFQQLGHKVVFLIGDFTAMIGDPTGKNKTRPPLDAADIAKNSKTYTKQVFKILDPQLTEVRFNSEWCKKLGAEGIIKLASQYNLARMLERDDFSKRYKSNQSIAIHEFLYPLIQAYDSIVLEADIELGGTDQKFNLLVGRELQRTYNQEPQVVITVPILEGLDGTNKMSKSLGNYVGIDEAPEEMFGKIMSISDELMWRWFDLLSFKSSKEIQLLKAEQADGMNPRDIKISLAKEIIARFHDDQAADEAEKNFINQFQKKNIPDNIEELDLNWKEDSMLLPNLLKEAGMTESTSEAMRMIKQGGVRIDEEKITDPKHAILKNSVAIYQVGKRKFKKIKL
ncbi:MAG: tyrosine--tRNA ligase [SAR86 cluster bacterium BACL1 MAG-121105-bin34]|jgi:tyrosyl-tRNA synthetase|uniref:Tyrosine--tRNA ligase n=2 Tax=SAR86 cluster TaxID=62672 RepID=A0A0R2UC53_9GAMM|nr:MAG: tyrosine--tRNA ligase [SAR86 cluster bacterium BACL1 MAG-120507-bin14]KRO41266.1 MAG: tyrosine--tRNA ligase [SAR86 cluster bacterium BACL1 MAG-120920-bin57]KRO95362.1 MAG: tyrosine--tRNA ligase [SAR86 cluster bacterium BACL1 MAG-120820-bin45]KRO96852.1 MAG: tyrosine--tRNA ligase [SAR86 cluster bacterium BACL1 MAG-120828-bin5]KRO98233.1 MAG: tyrosine--tRNA ligase [SAR86 cluster bacterium BACL1 MAG-120823-bin87]KRP00144.1 MAG: tyrosine--tRNA ligase [SAR86 cluster bacterium BACL1 MAG-1208